MGKVDKLSRRLDLKVEIENNSENQTLIKKKQIRGIIKVIVEESEMILVEKIKRVREKDKEEVKVIEEMKKVGVRVLRGDKWKIKGKLVLKKRKIYILKNKKLKLEVIQLHYNILVAGHRDKWKITGLVTRNYLL